MIFKITTPIPTAEKAFDWLFYSISCLDWYVANNRSNRLDFFKNLNHPLINDMMENRNLSKQDFRDKYFLTFKDTMYKQDVYISYIKKINEVLPIVQSCYSKVKDLQQNWGFEILNQYHIDIDLFGVGGKYHRDEKNIGHVILGAGNNWTDKDALAHIIVHEMIHLGIEDLLINPNHQKQPPVFQEEKERIVDNLCVFVTKENIPNYKRKWKDGTCSRFQELAKDYAYMDNVVGTQPLNNLVKAVQNFLKENKRS